MGSTQNTSHITQQSVTLFHNKMSSNGTQTSFEFHNLPRELQNAVGGGGKSDVRLAKQFVRERPDNDDVMKRVYTMAQKYMNYGTNEFSSVWTKVVLPTIKSEMNLLRSGYAAAIKSRVIRGKYNRS